MLALSSGTARSRRLLRTQQIPLPSLHPVHLRNLCRWVSAGSYRLASLTIAIVFVRFRASPALHAPTIRPFGFPESKASAPEPLESALSPLAAQRLLSLTSAVSKIAARTEVL